jgi:integrase
VTARGFDALVTATRRRGDGEARHLVAVARTLFGWATRRGIIPTDPMAEWLAQQRGGRNQLPRWMAQPARERVLDDAEVAWLWAAVSGGSFGAQARAFIVLLLLTGCRAGEIAKLDWSEVDLNASAIRLPSERTKNGTAHAVTLSGLAKSALSSIAPGLPVARRTPTAGPVFGGGIRNNTGRLLISVRCAVGLREHWTWHDLRRTVATGLARLGCPVHVTEAVLNHVQGEKSGLARVYQRHDHREESRVWLLRWQTYIGDVCGVDIEADPPP